MDLMSKITTYFLLESDGDKTFFASLLVQMVKEESNITPTMAVTIKDGLLYLLYNKEFVNSLYKQNKRYLIPLVEHELLHIVYDHITRADNRDPVIWNLATDMAVNSNVKDIKEVKWTNKDGIVASPVLPDKFGFPEGKTAEWYYDQLLKNAKKVKLSFNFDDHSKWIKTSNKNIYKEIIKRAVAKAYNQAKKRGYLSGHLEEIIKELLKPPTINWRELLRQYVAYSIKSGYKSTWKRLNRRFPHLECIKGKTSDRTIKILVAFDTSGSININDFKDFLAEIKGLLNVYRCIIDYIECDAEIKAKGRIYPWSKLRINFKGRGGTDYKPVFKYFNRTDYDLLIYFTDLYCDYEGCKTNKDVIWVVTREYNRDNKPPFGKLVEIKK